MCYLCTRTTVTHLPGLYTPGGGKDGSIVTTYEYDSSGMRAIKKGKYGTVQYVSENYVVRNKDLISKHVFAGNTRLVSNMVMQEEKSGKMVSTEQGCYYYHADHLGSSSVVTDKDGKFYEQLEYFPYGETWVHNKATSDDSAQSTPYKFTGKELDPETGLYYFGARYYDGKLSRWLSTDPAYSTMEFYDFCYNNPIIYVDPDGKFPNPFGVASVGVSAYFLYDDIQKGDAKLIAISSAALFFDLVSCVPLAPSPGGAGYIIQAQRLIRHNETIINETKYIVSAGKNAATEYNKSGGDLKTAGLMFAGSYFLERGSSFGILKGAERYLPGGKKEEMSEFIYGAIDFTTKSTNGLLSESISDKVQGRSPTSNNKSNTRGSEINPWSVDWTGSGKSVLDMITPEMKYTEINKNK